MLNQSLSNAPDLMSLKLTGTDIVNLNIGGMTTLMTTVSVLTQCAESKLAKLFEKPELLPRVTGDEKTIFLDRDGPTFMNMINYLRN